MSAQSTFSYQVTNLTDVDSNGQNGGTMEYPVVDNVNFTSLVLTETFKDGTSATLPLMDLNGDPANSLDSGGILLNSISSPYGFADRGGFQSAVLSGVFTFPGFPVGSTLGLTLQPNSDPTSQNFQTVYTSFSTVLGSTSDGVGLGTFNIQDANGNPSFVTRITATPVPEPSSLASIGLMILGLGTLIVARRRRTILGK